MTGRLCAECVGCEACSSIAYCLDDRPDSYPCPHDRALCSDCNLIECQACRLDAEADMHATGEYDPRKDPFYNSDAEATDDERWSRPPLTLPGSPGFRGKQS